MAVGANKNSTHVQYLDYHSNVVCVFFFFFSFSVRYLRCRMLNNLDASIDLFAVTARHKVLSVLISLSNGA